MGTFVANFTLFSSSGMIVDPFFVAGTHALWPFSSGPFSGNMVWSLDTISLDGGAPISWSGLPSGFTPVFGSVLPTTPVVPYTAAIAYLNRGSVLNDDQCTFHWSTFPTGVSHAGTPGVWTPITIPSLVGADSLDLQASIQADFLLTLVSGPSDASLACFVYDAIKVTGTYTIQSFTSTLDGVHIPPSEAMNPRSFTMGGGGSGLGHVPPGSIIKPTQIPPGGISPGYDFPPALMGTYITSANMNVAGNIKPGDIIRITTADPNLDLTDVTEISLTYLDNLGVTQIIVISIIFIFYQSPTLIIFEVPPYIPKIFVPTVPGYPNIPIIPKITIVGTTFSGSVSLAPIIITLADTSGIYFLSANKTNDTLYDNINTPDTTDVKIPDPFIKSGFIGG